MTTTERHALLARAARQAHTVLTLGGSEVARQNAADNLAFALRVCGDGSEEERDTEPRIEVRAPLTQ